MPQKKSRLLRWPRPGHCRRNSTPFHLYDEAGIRENARKGQRRVQLNKGFKEYFCRRGHPEPPYILKILQEEGCGVDDCPATPSC